MRPPDENLPTPQFDAFLSHSSVDKPKVEALANRLIEKGLTPWLDKWNLVPGEPWMPALEVALKQSRACVVFIGSGPLGPWQHEEMRVAIDRRVKDRDSAYRVVPVLLPGAVRGPSSQLPDFLTAATWVEFGATLDDEDALHRLECGIRGVAPGRGPGAAPVVGECPYPGLTAFEEQDAALFFGRDAEVGWLLDKLKPRGDPAGPQLGRRFLAVVGASGSGKSSLVRAGLIPALRKGRLPGSAAWPVAVVKPGAQPLESLAVALGATEGLAAAAVPNPRAFIDEMAKDARALHLAVRTALFGRPESARAVVFVDQFEEVFTLCTNDGQRAAFIDTLTYAALEPVGPTVVVLSMRSDFYGQCAAHPQLVKALSDDRQVLVGPMQREALREAIERPAALGGRALEPGLTELLLNDVERQPGALPLMQHALRLLWQQPSGPKLTVKAYEDLGRVDGALENHANAVYDEFSPDEQRRCQRVFERLTQPGEGTEDTKRRARREEFRDAAAVDAAAVDAAATDAVIDRLARARLITADQTAVEVSHEALTRSWSKLRAWIDGRRAAVKIQNALSEAASEWDKNKRNPAYLYRGARLLAAEEWAQGEEVAPSALEKAFLDASIAQRDQEAREKAEQQARELRLLRWQRGAFAALVVAMVAFGAAWMNRPALVTLWNRRHFYPYALSASAVAALEPRQTFYECDPGRVPPLCPQMVVIPASSPEGFMMGSEENEDEQPVHPVVIAEPFAVSATEVTFDEWDACVGLGGCRDVPDSGWGRKDRPVINVNWHDAQAYVKWLSTMTGAPYRLLSEAEWEYATRAGTTGDFSFDGPISTSIANCDGRSTYRGSPKGEYRARTVAAGSLPANRWGLHEVHGNVWEWVQDCWHPHYQNAPRDGSAWMNSDQSDCSRAVVRGGSWYLNPVFLRSAIRFHYARVVQSNHLGFRVARTLTP